MENNFIVGDLICINCIKGVFPVEKVSYVDTKNKVQIIRIPGGNVYYSANARKATSKEITDYKLKNIFFNQK